MVVAEKYLGMEVEHREVYFDELKDFAECGLCGTAAVIHRLARLLIMAKKSASQAEWMKWVLLQRNYMIH